MPANIAVNSSGWMVTSKSCSKLRRIFMVARQAMVKVWLSVALSPTRGDRPASGSRRVVVRAVIGRSPARVWVVLVARCGLAGVVTGQRQEHLVERRLLDADGVDADALRRAARPGRRRPGRCAAAAPLTSRASGESTGGSPVTRSTTARGVAELARRRPARSCRVEDPIDVFSSSGVPCGDLAAVVDDRDPVGELVGLVEVLRGQQHRAAVGDQLADRVPHLAAGAGVEPGGGLVEEDQRRPGDQAGREVEPPPHAARRTP